MKKIFSIALMLALCCAAAGAQEQEKKVSPGIADWLRALQHKIAQIVPKKTIPMSNGVAGVRGTKEDAAVRLYWKGKKADEAVTEEEMAKFRSGVDLAEKGDRDASLRQFEEFMKQYPDSALIPDAKKTYDIVKAAPAAENKAGPTDEQQAGQRAAVNEEKK
jgi:TolA-binding protein